VRRVEASDRAVVGDAETRRIDDLNLVAGEVIDHERGQRGQVRRDQRHPLSAE